MAAISSNTDVALANLRMLWSNTSSWVGGVVPTVLDDVTITSTKTTINQAAIAKWSGTITITVASTSGFPSTGFFYTYTTSSDYVKVNYTGTTGTTFTGCSIDFTDPLCNWKYSTSGSASLPTNYYNYGSYINNGYYVYAPSPLITIPASYQANVSTLIIQNGGILNVEPGANLGANNWITVRDGRFIGRANTGNISTIMVNRLEGNGVGYFQTENYPMSILDVDGGETRSYGTTNTAIAVGDVSINITPVLGTINAGDEIAIYDTSYANTRVSFYPYRDVSNDWSLVRDEGFDVISNVSNQIFLARRNGARGKIKSIGTNGAQKILSVDKNDYLSQMNFKAGDIVVIANTKYTIDSVTDSDYLLGTYNFQTGSTLTDFLSDYAQVGSYAIDAYGAYSTNNNPCMLVHKQFFRREIIVEAEMSPLNQYSTGSRGTDQYGLIYAFDPSFRSSQTNRYPSDGTMTGTLANKDSGTADGRAYMTLQSKYSYPGYDYWTDTSVDGATPSLKTILQGPNTQKIELRNHILKAFVNGEQVAERFDSSGGHRGLAGIYTWNNQNVRIKSITYRAPTQDLYITTANTFTLNDTVWESGAEYTHYSGQRMLKIASKVIDPGTHDDLAFNYRGQYSANTWPFPAYYNNNNTSSSIWYLGDHNWTYAHEVYVDLGTTVNANVVIDLAKTQTFTHISITPRMDDVGSVTGAALRGVQIWGSNDNSTYTNLYGPTDDVKRYCNPQSDGVPWYMQMGHYYTGSQSYRYVKIVVNGHNGSANPTLNRLMKLGVYNFASNNYTINVTNTSDFANGDVITVLPHSSYISTDDYHHYQAVKAGQNIDTYYHTPNTHSTVINVIGNTLYLDRPINYGFVEGKESVVKINRNFKMLGFLSNNGETKFQKPYFRVNQGSNPCQIRLAKNWQFYNVGSSRISGSSFSRGVDFSSGDYWNIPVIDGISVIGYNNSDANGLTFQSAHAICRNGYVGNVRDYRPYYSNSRQGVVTYNMKMNSLYRFRPESNQNRVTNYNECAGARHWDCMVVYDTDFFTSTVPVEFRRNNLHGIYQIPGFIPGSGSLTGDSTGQVIKNEYNLLYATNLAAYNQGPTQETWQPLGMDIHAEHPGLRLSWQRNEGFIGWYNTAGDDSAPLYGLKDFMRADYNFCQVVYEPIIQRAGWDFIRTYRPTDDTTFPKTQFIIYSKTAVPFQIYVEFEYRYPFRIDRAYNISITNGIGILAAQNGVALSGYPIYNLKPTNSDWYRYSATITGFASAIGVATVSLIHRSMEFTADLRNMRAYVMTNNPNEIVTLGNTFDVNKYFNITNDKKYMAPISAGANKFKKVKF